MSGSGKATGLVLLGWILAGCTVLGDADCASLPPPVLLISIDTLRADHLGCYGYGFNTSPQLNRFASESWLFERAYSSASSTLLSHASLFSGLHARNHGASHARRIRLPAEIQTLAESFRDAGYRTAAFTGGGQLAAEFGLDQGFDIYSGFNPKDFDPAVDAALEWVGVGSQPFFLFLHTYEVHHPYLPSADSWNAVDGPLRTDSSQPISFTVDQLRAINWEPGARQPGIEKSVVAAYDAGIRSVDDTFGRLRAGLERKGLWDPLLVVVTSDHGEELGEHGLLGWHATTVFEELLHVPLLLKLPAAASPRRLGHLVSTVALAQALLDLAKIRNGSAGAGLAEVLREQDDRAVIAYGETEQTQFDTIRIGRLKWIEGQLFDLSADPGETRNVAADHPEELARLERRLRAEISDQAASQRMILDPQTSLQLEALGYSGNPP